MGFASPTAWPDMIPGKTVLVDRWCIAVGALVAPDLPNIFKP